MQRQSVSENHPSSVILQNVDDIFIFLIAKQQKTKSSIGSGPAYKVVCVHVYFDLLSPFFFNTQKKKVLYSIVAKRNVSLSLEH